MWHAAFITVSIINNFYVKLKHCMIPVHMNICFSIGALRIPELRSKPQNWSTKSSANQHNGNSDLRCIRLSFCSSLLYLFSIDGDSGWLWRRWLRRRRMKSDYSSSLARMRVHTHTVERSTTRRASRHAPAAAINLTHFFCHHHDFHNSIIPI